MRYLSLLVGLLVLLAACSTPEVEVEASDSDLIEGQYIVVLNDESLEVQSEEAFKARVDTLARELDVSLLEPLQIVNGFSAKFDAGKLSDLEADERVAFVEQDFYVEGDARQRSAPWGLNYMDGRNDKTYSYNSNGSGVTAYIIDSGIRADHRDFGGRVDVSKGINTVQDGYETSDCNGHGTHVASTVGGSIYGVAKNVTLVPVRVLGCNNRGLNSDILAGVDFVTRTARGPSVINMSIGGDGSRASDIAIANATRRGITVVVSAGNDTQSACNVSPARAKSAITVASTTRNLSRSGFSNYGSCVDIFAPGSDVVGAWNTSPTATNRLNGTSMASPHVAGVVALILQTNPNASPRAITNYLTRTSFKGIVRDARSDSPNRFITKGSR